MGWLFQEIGDFFSKNDGSFPEICICGLSAEEVNKSYKLIREKSRFNVGKPTFFNREAEKEMDLDEVEDASAMVTEGKAQPFHFMVREICFGKRHRIPELGVFILHNAIALDYEKGPCWGEIEIEALLLLILQLLGDSEKNFIKLEESVSQEDRDKFAAVVKRLCEEEGDKLPTYF